MITIKEFRRSTAVYRLGKILLAVLLGGLGVLSYCSHTRILAFEIWSYSDQVILVSIDRGHCVLHFISTGSSHVGDYGRRLESPYRALLPKAVRSTAEYILSGKRLVAWRPLSIGYFAEPALATYGIVQARAIEIGCPLIVLTIPLAVGIARLFCYSHWLSRRRRQLGLCSYCAYSLVGNMSGTCPECGTALENTSPAPVQRGRVHLDRACPDRVQNVDRAPIRSADHEERG